MIRRTARWWTLGVTLITLMLLIGGVASAAPATTFDFQYREANPVLAPEGEAPPLQGGGADAPPYLSELNAHQQIAIFKIYGETTLEAMPEQQALSRAMATFAPDRVSDRPAADTGGSLQWTLDLPEWMWTRAWPARLPATGLAADLSVHERAALQAIFGTDDLIALDAAADLAALARPVIINTSPAAVNAAVVRQMLSRMTIHEQLALQAIYGDVSLEPSPVRNAIAPYAELVTKGEVTPAQLPWRPRLRTEVVARQVEVHEKAAILAIFGDGFAPRDPERQAVAPIATLLSERAVFEMLAPAALVDRMSVHEQAAILAVLGDSLTADPEQRAVAPLAAIVGARITPHTRLSPAALVDSMSVHQQAAILAVLGDSLTADPERAAVAPLVGLIAARLPCAGMDAILAELSVHERCAVLAICGNPLWANDPEQCAAHMLASMIKVQKH